ncbi:MAG: cupin domain-containing protein [Candidatus Rifleibacteriota bacterium]
MQSTNLKTYSRMLIEKLQLERHPEGGYYREIYRSNGLIPASALAESHSGIRPFLTSIYFMLEPGDVSSLHRLKSDEIWYFHAGSSLSIHIIFPDGRYEKLCLGPDIESGQSYQQIVPAGCWFGATVNSENEPSLVGCAVAPGFDFADFEMAEKEKMLRDFPQHKDLIEMLCRQVF